MTDPEAPAAWGADSDSLIVFLLGAAEYALPLGSVAEVVRTPPITRVPFPPEHVRGVLSLRGTLMTTLDAGSRLGIGPVERGERALVVDAGERGERVALLVDAVTDLWEATTADELEEPPAEARAGTEGAMVRGVVRRGRRVATLLDPVRLMDPLFHEERTGGR